MDANVDDTARERLDKLKALSKGLYFPRAMLRSFFDEWVAQSGVVERCPGFLYAIASGHDLGFATAIDPANRHDALALALLALEDDRQVLAFMAAAVAAGLFDDPKLKNTDCQRARDSLMARVVDTVGAEVVSEILPQAVAQDGVSAEAQAHDASVIWIDPGHVLPAIIHARRRLCKIMRPDRFGREQNLGTGFLIGPSAVLTNHHVVKDIDTGEVKKRKLLCRFDYSETTGMMSDQSAAHLAADQWHICSSPMGLKQPDNAQVDWWADDDTRDAFLDSVADKLDYAVIRLENSPGLQRGWYDLENLPQGLPAHAIALHHPAGLEQTFSMGNMDFSGLDDVRLFHQASTANGSSGGLLLNQSGEPIGLHHLGIGYEEHGKKRFMNVAISLKHIRDDLAQNARFADVRKSALIVPPLGCIDGKHPLFGRADLLTKLQRMWDDPTKRILTVHYKPGETPIKKPGKSFTIDIIKGLFRAPEHKHIVFRAGETEADALTFVNETIDNFASGLISNAPDMPQSTTAAHVQDLVRFFVAEMQEHLPNRDVWLMIDDLDRHRISDGSGREFLATIYDTIEQIPGLRVVLIGLPREISISGLNPRNLEQSEISETDLSTFDKLFAEWFRQRSASGRPVNDTAVELLASTMGSYAQQPAPLQAMSDFVVTHMSGVAGKLFDKGAKDE